MARFNQPETFLFGDYSHVENPILESRNKARNAWPHVYSLDAIDLINELHTPRGRAYLESEGERANLRPCTNLVLP